MSHLIEEYAKHLGVKIGNSPVIFEHFWPMPFDKYIVINSGAEVSAKTYKYFGMVLDMLVPVLKNKGISVVQIGTENDNRLENVSLRLFDLTARQVAFVVSRSLLYLGSDSVWSHYANSKKVPIVTLHGNAFANISNGFWGGPQINIEGKWEVCPSFSANDPHLSINKIKPEEIAHACCKMLHIDYKNSLKTEFIGKLFGEAIVEIVPDFSPNIPIHQRHSYFLRCDYTDNMFLPSWCKHLPRFSAFIDKNTDMDCLAFFQQKIASLFIEVEDGEEDTREFVRRAAKICKNTMLLAKNKNLNSMRNQWFDYRVLPKDPDDVKKIQYKPNLFIASSKLVMDKDGQYSSLYHRRVKNFGSGRLMPMPKDAEFLSELEHFALFEKNP